MPLWLSPSKSRSEALARHLLLVPRLATWRKHVVVPPPIFATSWWHTPRLGEQNSKENTVRKEGLKLKSRVSPYNSMYFHIVIQFLQLHTTSFKWMLGWKTISHVEMWNHPIETTMSNGRFRFQVHIVLTSRNECYLAAVSSNAGGCIIHKGWAHKRWGTSAEKQLAKLFRRLVRLEPRKSLRFATVKEKRTDQDS